MRKIKINVQSNNYANIFLKRLYYVPTEILRRERREKLDKINEKN